MIKILFFIIFIYLVIYSGIASANQVWDAVDSPPSRSVKDNPTLKEIGILTGYASSKATDKDDYVTIPIFLRLGIDCDKFGLGFSDWIERGARDIFHKNFRPAGMTEFLIEPFLAYVPSPDSNMEGGLIIAFKYEWPLTQRFHPYIWNGGGVMYTTQHLREQSTQWNFTPQIGLGFSYLIDKNKTFNMEYRHRHFSNADTNFPNDGVNQRFISFGFTWQY